MLVDPFPRWFTHMLDTLVLALVRSSQLFATWPFYKAALGVVTLQQSSWVTQSKTAQGKKGSCNASYDPVCEFRHHHFCHIFFIRSESLKSSQKSSRGEFQREKYQRICGQIFKPPQQHRLFSMQTHMIDTQHSFQVPLF